MSILFTKETKVVGQGITGGQGMRLWAFCLIAATLLGAGPSFADPHTDAVFAEYQHLCVETRASSAAIDAAVSGKAWQRLATRPGNMGPDAIGWAYGDETGQYFLAVGSAQIDAQAPEARLCALTIHPSLGEVVKVTVKTWLHDLAPLPTTNGGFLYLFIERDGKRSNLTRGDATNARAALNDGSFRMATVESTPEITQLSYATSEPPSN